LERISTGINELDEMLCGGYPEGSTILIVGRPGTGKTIFAHQMMFHNATPAKKAIYLTTLAEPQVKVMRFQQELDFFDHAKFQKTVIYHDLGSILRRRGSSQCLAYISELLQKYQPSLTVVDAVKSLADMIPSFTEFREFLLDLSLRLATWGCTALLLGEYSEEDIEVRPECAIADGIVYLSGTEEEKRQKRYLRIMKMRGTGYVGGQVMYLISEKGLQIFPRLKPEVGMQSYGLFTDRISTGLAGLDEMTGGGITRATTTLLSGSSGTGKTVLALHFAYAGLVAGEAAVYVSFEENPGQLTSSARRLGLDLQPYIDSGQFHLLHVSPIELDVDEHTFIIQKLVREAGALRLVIDSISAFEIGMADKIQYTDFIWALSDYFKTCGVSLLLTHELHDWSQASEITRHGISYLADNLLLLRFLEHGLDVTRYLRVVKMRGSGHVTKMRELRIGDGGMELCEV